MNKSLPLNRQRFVSFFLFLVFCFIGWWLALKKPLWNDEIYTQTKLDTHSNPIILKGEIPEGNNAPLFYLLQNFITDGLSYHLPFEWRGEWYVADFKGQQIMRLQPVLCMSLMLALIYYHFAFNGSVLAGCYALGVSLSSYMVWAYWAEARPYTLWMLLSAAQILLFLSIIKDNSIKRNWWMLIWVHWLLAFTVVVSLPQVVIVSALLWYFSKEKKDIKRYVVMAFLPMVITLFYYSKAPIYWYQLIAPVKLFFDNITPMQIVLLISWVILFLWRARDAVSEQVAISRAFFLLFFAVVLSSVLMLLVIALKSVPGAGETSSRMLIYLTPYSIIGTVLASEYFWNKSKDLFWIRVSLGVVFVGVFVLFNGLVTLQNIVNSVVY